MPPQLPPRQQSQISVMSGSTDEDIPHVTRNNTHLTPQASFSQAPNHPYSNFTGLDDPRSSSTQSIQPVESRGSNRRKLLLVYIHGFMGTETSFKSFPAHVHSLLALMLSESHVVHTKIYPRYASRKDVSFARDAFSNWLYPHESDTTDVVLLGHSLGGILGAEVVILPSHQPNSHELLQHRILGLIAFDTPFLGMHPSVVSTGIASLFRGAPELPSPDLQMSNSNPSEVFDASQNDPNYNPAFPNDVRKPSRKKWERAWYFLNKHADDLGKATQSYLKSHLEFGGCLADYPGLRKRYDAVRALEDIDELAGRKGLNGLPLRRVRFVNYYSASTGRTKEEKSTPKEGQLVLETEMQGMDTRSRNLTVTDDQSTTPRISIEEHRDGEIINKLDDLEIESENEEMTMLEPRHEDDAEDNTIDQFTIREESLSTVETQDTENHTSNDTLPNTGLQDDLPPLPPLPKSPPDFNPEITSDPEALKLAWNEHSQQVKQYERAKKDFEKAIKAREKLVNKRERTKQKELDKIHKKAQQEQQRVDREKMKRQTTLNPEEADKQLNQDTKKKRDRKFCSLPTKDPKTGIRDPTWIRIYMEGVDEVVAHTTLFNISDTYAKLVGDTAERITDWVHEDATTKALMQERELGGT